VLAAADEPLRSEPVLAAEVAASTRANVLHWAAGIDARPAPQCHVAHAPAAFGGFLGRVADALQLGDFLRHTGSKRMPVRAVLRFVREEWCRHPMIIP
jgi:hypothetical protein